MKKYFMLESLATRGLHWEELFLTILTVFWIGKCQQGLCRHKGTQKGETSSLSQLSPQIINCSLCVWCIDSIQTFYTRLSNCFRFDILVINLLGLYTFPYYNILCCNGSNGDTKTWQDMSIRASLELLVVDQISWKKSGDLMIVWLWCAKVYSLFLLYIQLHFCPNPSPPPSPLNQWHSHDTSYHHCYNSQWELTCKKKATKQRRAKKGLLSVSFFHVK